MRRTFILLSVAFLAACANRPPAPGWEASAKGGLDRYVSAFMSGNDKVAEVEFARARTELAATGRPDLVARAELTRCALQVAALQGAALEGVPSGAFACAGFEPLRADADAGERAYAHYLAGHVAPADVALLPEQHRAVAGGKPDAASLPSQPLARLVAAGVLFRSGRASPEVVAAASDTASSQGWRRPLLAWLGVQARLAERAGDTEAASRIRRRIALAAGG